MSFVTTQPEVLAAAAGQLQGIGAAIAAQNAAAAAPTLGVVPAAADEVSALDGNAIQCTRRRLPDGERSSCGDPRHVRADPGRQRRFVRRTEAANAIAAS